MIQPLRGWKGRCLKEDATVCSKGKGEGRVKGGVEAPFPRGWEGTSAGEGKMCKLKRTAGERGGGGVVVRVKRVSSTGGSEAEGCK